jgi:hypothetical protein
MLRISVTEIFKDRSWLIAKVPKIMTMFVDFLRTMALQTPSLHPRIMRYYPFLHKPSATKSHRVYSWGRQ